MVVVASDAQALTAVVLDVAPCASGAVALPATCRALAADRWTPDALRAALAATSWTGAGPGAVITALRQLGPPPRARPRASPCTACRGTGLIEDATGAPSKCPCTATRRRLRAVP